MVSGSEEIAESLNKCVKNLATAAEALQKLRNETGNQISERLTMVTLPGMRKFLCQSSHKFSETTLEQNGPWNTRFLGVKEDV